MAILCLLGAAMLCSAQESPNATPKDPSQGGIQKPADEPSKPDQEGYRTLDILYPEPDQTKKPATDANASDANIPIPIPISPIDENQPIGGQSFVDDVFQSSRNQWGFSLAAYQAFSNDISASNRPRESSGITAFMPRAFFNFGKRKSKFHVDLGAGYRMYNKSRKMDSWDYSGNAEFSREFSKNTSLQISDQFTSSYNDSWSFLSLYSPLQYDLLSSNEVLFNRQRINRNSIRADLDHRLSRKASFGLFGGYRWYDYPEGTLQNSHAIEMGGDFRYQLAEWLYVASSVTTYFNLTDENSSDARIYHIQFGGLEFRLGKSWRTWAGGGIDISDYEGSNRMGEHVNAGIGYTSSKTSFQTTYQRGFTSTIGFSRLLISDVINAGLGRRFNNWLNGNLQAYYYRSKESDSEGLLETLSGGGGLGFALRRDLSLSINASYQNQKTRDFSVEGLRLSRLSAYVGLQYVWPSRRSSD